MISYPVAEKPSHDPRANLDGLFYKARLRLKGQRLFARWFNDGKTQSVLLNLVLKLVPHSWHVQDILRIGGVRFQLAP